MSAIGRRARDYQEQVRSMVPRRFRLPRIFTVLALAEELGEFISEIAASSQRTVSTAGELGDILFSCAEIANEYDFSILAVPNGFESLERATMPDLLSPSYEHLTALLGKIAKAVLETECFGKDARPDLTLWTQEMIKAIFDVAERLGFGPVTLMDGSIAKMAKRVAAGKWEEQYGDILLIKQEKHN
jgi:hypothetical protein